MRGELDIIRTGLHANAVRLGGRDPRRLLAAAGYAASAGLDVWLGPELWNAVDDRVEPVRQRRGRQGTGLRAAISRPARG